MILRKLATALQNQNWSIVFLEILIVVVGLFIGLQVDGWNEARKDRAREQAYLERLGRDLHRDAELLAVAIRQADERAAGAILAMDGLENPAVLATDHCLFLTSASKASQNFFPILHSHTFEEIVSNGHLALIRSDELKDALGQYYTAHQSAEQWMNPFRQINLDYAKAFAGVLSRAQIAALKVFEQGGACSITHDAAMLARQEIIERKGLPDWLPRLQARQEYLALQLRSSLANNEQLIALISR